MQKFLDLFFLLRIPLLAPVWTILLLGWIGGNPQARIGGSLTPGIDAHLHTLWITVLGFSLIVSWIYVTNQIADIESDRINHKLFLLPSGIVSIPMAWTLAWICALAGLVIAAVFLDKLMVLFFSISLLMGYLYNFPPASLKNRAWGGIIANFLGHGVLTFVIGWHAAYLNDTLLSPTALQTLTASLSAGFANAAVYITTTIPDAEGDRRTGKHTFCVKYGERNAALAAGITCALSLVFAFTLKYNAWVMIVPAALSTLLFIYLIVLPSKTNAFKALKWPVFILSLSVAVFVPAYVLLIVITFVVSRIYYKWRFNIEYPTFKAQ